MKRRKHAKDKEHLSQNSAQSCQKSGLAGRSAPLVGDVSLTRVCVLALLAVSGTTIILHDLGYLSHPPDKHRSPDHRHATLHTDLSEPAPRDGGWRQPDKDLLNKYGSSVCNVDRVYADQMTVGQFEKKYRNRKPVIVVFRNGTESWTQPEVWSVDGLRRGYGAQVLMAGVSREIVHYGGNGYEETTVSDFIDSIQAGKPEHVHEPFYVFDRAFIQDSHLLDTLKQPEYLSNIPEKDDSFFFLGSSGSGVSFHNHAEAWNGVVFGAKRWFLYPKEKTPPGGVYPGYSQIDWFSKVYPTLSQESKPIECVQRAGEIIYLPEGMYHATINIGDTVAVGIQKKKATIPEMKLQYEEDKLNKGGPSEAPRRYECIKKLHILLPGNAEWEMKLGEILFSEMRQPMAGLDLTELALRRDPLFLVALINLARFRAELGQHEEAEILFVRALEQNPKAWDVYAQYGTFLYNEKRFPEAVTQFMKGYELKPSEKAFLIYLHDSQIRMGDHSGAEITQQKLKNFQHGS